ncbi:MAG TPA: sigma-70 family RNA polymerase sigma factor [Gaiellaceae bacterium]|nr:sigma-70 family RNA polymerase sigma factor [Gaiellaceae bacterium]
MTVAPAPSDAALVARLRSRDRTAWEDVYALYSERLYKFAYHLAGNPHDAADLVQETFLRVLPKLDSLDPETLDLGAYLFATERNLFLKSVERSKRQQPVDEIPEPTGPRPIEDDPQRSTLLADQQERVRRANAALPPRQRLVLALRELEDRSYAEIGELVGLKENAVAQLISRARLRLRDELRLVEVDRSKLPEECQAMLPLLSSYLDGQLKGAAAERTVAHVESCELCQKALTEMREASRLYRALIPIPFPELFGRIDDALASSGFWEGAATGAQALARSKGAWIAAGAVAASLALVLAVGALLLESDPEPAAARAEPQPLPQPQSVADTSAPRLVLPEGTIAREAAGPAGTRVTYAARAEDEVDGAVAVSCSPVSGAVFPLGETEVSCTAQDTAGNETEGTFAVAVADSTAPVLTAPGSLEVEAEGPTGAPVAYRAGAQDRAGRLSVSCSPRGGTVFPLGETEVECTARDGAGNVARKRFMVTVVDSTPPELTIPEAVAVEAGAPLRYSATARDAVDGLLAVDCSVPSGRVLAIGATTVSCRSEDAAGNLARKTFVVRVGDTTAPSLRLPDDLTVEATGTKTRVTYNASAREPGGRALPVRCRPASGARLPLGRLTVRCSAADAHGNAARGTFVIAVVDSTAPKLAVPSPPAVEATGPAGAKVEYQVTAKDLVDRRPGVGCTPASGSTFPLGATTVRCSAGDASGNRGEASFPVTVVDTTAPTLVLPSNRTVQAASTKGATVTYAASATDLVDGPVTPTCSPVSGANFPVGATTVTCTARDTRGNQSSGSFVVTVTPFPQPDLVVSSVTGTRFTITNRGSATAGAFVVTVQGIGTFTFAGLAAGASATRTVSCASIQRLITIDPQNQVAESNEANNTARIPPC